MIEFFEWMKRRRDTRPWCVLGKGPSFRRRGEIEGLAQRYQLLGLNHVCREQAVHVTHVIDANVLDEVPGIWSRTGYLVMPWHPHVDFRPSPRTLAEFAREHAVLGRLEREERLLWYNASTWQGAPRNGSPKVKVVWFSAEAAVRLLAMAGVTEVRTLGIDGGSRYADDFKDLPPFRGGHTSFDLQTAEIRKTVEEFGLRYGPLLEKPPG